MDTALCSSLPYLLITYSPLSFMLPSVYIHTHTHTHLGPQQLSPTAAQAGLHRIRRKAGSWEVPTPVPDRRTETSGASWVWWLTPLISRWAVCTAAVWAAGPEDTRVTRNSILPGVGVACPPCPHSCRLSGDLLVKLTLPLL